MKIIIIGATGTIGRAVVDLLAPGHEIVRVGHQRGDFKVDIASKASIRKLFEAVGNFDAVVSAAGQAKFGELDRLRDEDYMLGLEHKLMGQVNLVRVGQNYINNNGSFTLTSGVLLASGSRPRSTAIENGLLVILRGVNLLGINSVATPRPARLKVWERLATDLMPGQLDLIGTRTVPLSGLGEIFAGYLEGKVRGRTVVDLYD